MTIPKILHFTWKTKTLTRFFQDIFDAWKKTHPDWEIRLYDDADIRALVADHYPQHLATFDAYPSGIYRADAFRFFVLHKYGGVYSDLDVLPVRRIDEVIERSNCFVGAEPELHVAANDARYRGMPFVLCNAFMGSVPGHPFWEHCMDRMQACLCDDVVDATGPRFVNGVALTIPRCDRPDVMTPNYWSPLAGEGRKSPTTPHYVAHLAEYFTLIGDNEPTLVSHLWRHSWFMKFAYNGPQFWRWPNRLQWASRRLIHRDMARTRYVAPRLTYQDQEFRPLGGGQRVLLGLAPRANADLTRLASALIRLSYPRELVTLAITGDRAEALADLLRDAFTDVKILQPGTGDPRNRLLDEASALDYALIVGDEVSDLPPGATETLISAGRPVVTAFAIGTDGEDSNAMSFLYGADVFKDLYRSGARNGVAINAKSRSRIPFGHVKYLNLAPLTCTGDDLLLIDAAAIKAGVRFAEAPYKFYVGSQGLAIQARDLGFEVSGMPGVKVTVARAGD